MLSDTKHANDSEMKTKRPFLTTKEIQTLKKAGWEIGCHSATHANLTTVSQGQLNTPLYGPVLRYILYPESVGQAPGLQLSVIVFPSAVAVRLCGGGAMTRILTLVKSTKGISGEETISSAAKNAVYGCGRI